MGGTPEGHLPPLHEAAAWRRLVERCIPECLEQTTKLELAIKEATAAADATAPKAEPAFSLRVVPVAPFYEDADGAVEKIMQRRYSVDFVTNA